VTEPGEDRTPDSLPRQCGGVRTPPRKLGLLALGSQTPSEY